MAYRNYKALLYVQAIWYTRHEAPWIIYVDVRQVNSKKQHKKRNGSFGFIPYIRALFRLLRWCTDLFCFYFSMCSFTHTYPLVNPHTITYVCNIYIYIHVTYDPVQIQHVSILRWCSFEVATFLNHGRRKPIEPWLQLRDIHLYVLTSRCPKSTGVVSLHQVWLGV